MGNTPWSGAKYAYTAWEDTDVDILELIRYK